MVIVGPLINGDSKGPISCHQMAVKDASTSQVTSHYFGIKYFIKDIPLEGNFKMMHRKYFNKPALSSSKIMSSSWLVSRTPKETVKKDNLYVIRLLFWDENSGIKKAEMSPKKILERWKILPGLPLPSNQRIC